MGANCDCYITPDNFITVTTNGNEKYICAFCNRDITQEVIEYRKKNLNILKKGA